MNNNYFNRLEEYLLDSCRNIGNFLSYSDVIEPKYDNGRFIPYFSREQFYILKGLLAARGLPKFYNENLKNLSCMLEKSYDILLASNILFYLYNIPGNKEVKEFKEILDKFNCSQIEALYGFGLNDFLEKELIENGFDIEKVQSGTRMMLHDYVVSLRKRRFY